MDDAALYIRLRAVCCSVWGIPPPEFERLAKEGRIAAEDAIEAMLLWASSGLGSNAMEYLFREQASGRRHKLQAMRALVTEYRTTKDPERRALLERRLRDVQD